VSIRVIIAEDSLIVREGIQQMLALQPDVDVVASCGDLPELMEAIEREAPDVVLTDIRMPPTQVDEGIKVASWLREAHPLIGVVVLSQYAEPS
jgi:DNA-binding NarL/FixJ family response regulator